MSRFPRRGIMLVLSSPSGAGKTTLARALLEAFKQDQLSMSVSVTTRKPRIDEKEGVDYYFVTQERFNEMVTQGGFIEYAEVFNHHYGTPRAQVEESLSKGHDVLFDIDWQGTQQLSQYDYDLVRIFILPPDAQTLEQRLKGRARDSQEVISQRMLKASCEISHYHEYDYVVVNDGLEQALRSITAILQAERLKRSRLKLETMVDGIRRHLEENR